MHISITVQIHNKMRNIKATKEMYSTQNNLIVLLLQLGFPKSYQEKKEREWYK